MKCESHSKVNNFQDIQRSSSSKVMQMLKKVVKSSSRPRGFKGQIQIQIFGGFDGVLAPLIIRTRLIRTST